MYLRQNLFSYFRFQLLFIFVVIFFGLFLVKLFDTQVIKYSYWKSVAKAQQTGVAKVYSKRGEIYAKDEFPLVLSVYSYDVVINPSISPDGFSKKEEELFKILYGENKIVDKEKKRSDWLKIFSEKSKKFNYLERDVSHEQKEAINKLALSYLSITPVPTRSYPDLATYSHILGFVGKDKDGVPKGYFGLEGFYDGNLNGVDGFTISEKSAGGFPILFKNFKTVDKKDGAGLVLTVDRNIQTIAFEELKKSVEKYQADSGSVIIINPKNGEIISMANFPTFDPTKYGEYFSKDPIIFVNKAVTSTYEPGSVMKALTMSAAVDLGVVNDNTIIDDAGPESYSGFLVDNWDGKHHGKITTTQILELSNNIGAAKVGTMVGRENLYKFFKKFGIASKTGIDLEGEETGFMRDAKLWEDIDLASTSFGQSLSVTPLQITSAFGAIANNGVLVRPHLVSSVLREGKLYVKEKENENRVIKSSTSDTLVKMLTSAAGSGEAKYFMSKKYNIAGKTGTAQIAEKGKYLKDATNATFVGFLPKYREFVMLVKLERPKTSVFASETAVPTWMTIAERIASYYGFSPDKNE